MEHTFTHTVVVPYILLEPLWAAVLIALFLRKRGSWAAALSTLVAALICFRALKMALGGFRFEGGTEWLHLGNFALSIGFKYDDLAALMLCIVGIVGLGVHVFSLGYMHDDAAKGRYFGGLSIFMFSMIGIVLADNLFMMFIFWELVGFSSWLLIGHWYEKTSASEAAKKAFITNRVGDFGFLIGIIWCYWANGTVNLSALGAHHVFSTGIALLLFCGAVGKSAQLPPASLAPRRDGRPDPGVRPHPCGHHGRRRCLHALPDQRADGSRRAHGHHVDRHCHRTLRRLLRHHAERYQEGPGLLHALPARLHGRGVWVGKRES